MFMDIKETITTKEDKISNCFIFVVIFKHIVFMNYGVIINYTFRICLKVNLRHKT